MHKKSSATFIFISLTLFSGSTLASTNEKITCGLKTVTINDGKIVQIIHEDGTVHSGSSISEWWSYNGKSIKHKLDDNRIPCGGKPKSRDEVISELSSVFVKNPSLHGMNSQEAQWMKKYTANLMRTDENCHLLVTAAKSMQRQNMFYIDCNNKSGNSRRYWVSYNDLKTGQSKPPATPISDSEGVISRWREK